VSKLENGRQTPSDDDVRAWTRATDSDTEAEALLASLHTLEIQHAEWQRQLRVGLRPHQNELAGLDARTRLFRAFESTVIPGLLQTAEYARARLAQGITKFHFVLTEAALRLRLCPPEVMLGQLDRLVSFSALPNVRLGIIGFESQYVVAPWHGFWILDHDRVMVETFSAELNLAQPQEIELYAGVFNALAAVASYGRAARAIITRVIDDLAPEAPEDGK
jgi:hypothetical protein